MNWTTPYSAGLRSASKSLLSPNNPVNSGELKSDPRKTSELLRDISKALQSPMPSPVDYVRKLEAELAAQATPAPGPSQLANPPDPSAAGLSPAEQSAKDLVASLERLLQQPAATPGRAALAALRQSQTEEVPAPAGWGSSGVVPTDPASPPNFSAGGGASGGRSAVTTLGSEAASPSLAAAPTNRWRFAAERAASFRRPPAAAGAVAGGSSAGSGRAVSRLRLDSSTLRHASPAADLLAEIEQAVSPTASPAAVVGLSLSAAASPSFSYQLDAAAAASPAGSSLPHPASPAAAWQQQAAAAGGQPAVTSRWKAAVTSGGSPGAASPQLAAYAFSAQPAGAFAQEASKVLEELQQFAGLERRSEADFAARVGEEMGRIFALPAGGC